MTKVCRKEWHYAHQQGKRMIPIIIENDMDFDALPRWMGEYSWMDFRKKTPESDKIWAIFITTLNTPDTPTAWHNDQIMGYDDLYALPDVYSWRNIAYHLIEADKLSLLRDSLLDYAWIDKKLDGGRVLVTGDNMGRVLFLRWVGE